MNIDVGVVVGISGVGIAVIVPVGFGGLGMTVGHGVYVGVGTLTGPLVIVDNGTPGGTAVNFSHQGLLVDDGWDCAEPG